MARRNLQQHTPRPPSAELDHRVDRVISLVREDLDKGRGNRAVQHFIEGYAYDLFPQGPQLATALPRLLGKRDAARLVTAFARFPCFYCTKGVEPCNHCNGAGELREHAVCARCCGFGNARCTLCDGSGWVAIGFVPPGLRLLVLQSRVEEVRKRLAALAAKPVPNLSARAPGRSHKACLREVNLVNRYLGILENTIAACARLRASSPKWRGRLSKLSTTCARQGVKAANRLRAALEPLAACSAHCADDGRLADADRCRHDRLADFYARLAECDTWDDTCLARPVLDAAMAPYAPRAKSVPSPSRKRIRALLPRRKRARRASHSDS